jgi:hypothetical protein
MIVGNILQKGYLGQYSWSTTSKECAVLDAYNGVLNNLYISSHNGDNDIRYANGFWFNVDMLTPITAQFAGWFAQTLTSSQYNGGGSQIWYAYWDGLAWSQVGQAVVQTKKGLFYTTSSSSGTCSLSYDGYWIPLGATWTSPLYYLWTDAFGCGNAPAGYYIDPQSYVRRYWNGSYFQNATNWNPATVVPHIALDFGGNAIASQCTPSVSTIRQHCSASTGTTIMNWTFPIMNYNNTSLFATSGYYCDGGNPVYYWNGTTGTWGSSQNITCQAPGMMSDIRAKENIVKTGVSESGLPMYDFNYIGKNERWNGVMAQDLLKLGREDAVIKDKDTGFYNVMYDKIDVDMKLVD